jgi:hypothetical protein
MMLLLDCFRRLKRAIIETYAKALLHLKVAITLSGCLSSVRDKVCETRLIFKRIMQITQYRGLHSGLSGGSHPYRKPIKG